MSELTLLWTLPLAGAAACLLVGFLGWFAARFCALYFGAAYYVVALAVLL